MMNRVLLIEDDEEQCIALSRMLRRRGLICVYVHTRAEGLGVAQSEKYDCLVHDLGLPDSDRMNSARLLHEFGDVPIIALTGDDDIELLRECQRHKVGYCLKPVDAAEIVGKVLILIERNSPSRPIEESIIENHRDRLYNAGTPAPKKAFDFTITTTHVIGAVTALIGLVLALGGFRLPSRTVELDHEARIHMLEDGRAEMKSSLSALDASARQISTSLTRIETKLEVQTQAKRP